jgi:ABC-type nitrate/sulfonate/bicarbonate transport system substrate-binding protein
LAESAGFTTLGLAVDYTPELPFTGAVVNQSWAASHRALLDRLLKAHAQSMAWFLDLRHRAEAIAMMVDASRQASEDVAKAYDFLQQRKFFDASGKISKVKMNAMLGALRELGDISPQLTIDRMLLPGVAQLAD